MHAMNNGVILWYCEGSLPMIPAIIGRVCPRTGFLDRSAFPTAAARPGSVGGVTDASEPTEAVNDVRSDPPDLGAIQRDLTAVEAALTALDDGSYWVDEVTGEPIPDEVLATNPVARRA